MGSPLRAHLVRITEGRAALLFAAFAPARSTSRSGISRSAETRRSGAHRVTSTLLMRPSSSEPIRLLSLYINGGQFSKISGKSREGKHGNDNANHAMTEDDLEEQAWPVRPSENEDVVKNAPHQGEYDSQQPVDAPA